MVQTRRFYPKAYHMLYHHTAFFIFTQLVGPEDSLGNDETFLVLCRQASVFSKSCPLLIPQFCEPVTSRQAALPMTENRHDRECRSTRYWWQLLLNPRSAWRATQCGPISSWAQYVSASGPLAWTFPSTICLTFVRLWQPCCRKTSLTTRSNAPFPKLQKYPVRAPEYGTEGPRSEVIKVMPVARMP